MIVVMLKKKRWLFVANIKQGNQEHGEWNANAELVLKQIPGQTKSKIHKTGKIQKNKVVVRKQEKDLWNWYWNQGTHWLTTQVLPVGLRLVFLHFQAGQNSRFPGRKPSRIPAKQ